VKLSVILEAVDRVTKPVREIAARVRTLNAQLGLDRLVGSVGKVGKAFGNVAKEARETATKLIASTGLIGGALFGLVKSAADAGDAAHDMSQKVGMGAADFQRMNYAAKMNGAADGDMAAGLRTLNKQIDAASKGNKAAADNFRRLGISVKDTHGKLKPTTQIVGEISDRFKTMPDGAKKSALAMLLMGDAGANLIQVMSIGSDGFREAAAEAERLGLVMDEKTVNSAGDFNDGLDRMFGALEGVRNAIASKLLPVLTPLIARFTDWIVANRELIATRVSDFIDALPGRIAAVRDTAAALYQRLSPVIAVFRKLVEWIGPTNAAMLVLGGIVGGKLLLSMAQLTLAFGGLTKALAVATIGAVKFAFALLANPIGLVIAAIAALAAGVYLIYRNWDTIGPWFSRLWDGVKSTFNAFGTWIKDGFSSLVIGAFKSIWDFIQPIIDKIQSGIDMANSAIQKFKGIGGGVANGFRSVLSSVAGGDGGTTSAGAAGVSVAGGRRIDTGGTMKIEIDDRRTRVTQARPNDPRQSYDTDVGKVMQ